MVYDKESVGTLAIAIDRVGVLRVELYDQEHAAAKATNCSASYYCY